MVTDGLSGNAQLALDTVLQKPTEGIPSWLLNIMEHAHIERLAGARSGEYKEFPEKTYLAMQRAIGTCLMDQYIPENPLSMGDHGYEGRGKGATTGADVVTRDGIVIDSPEAVVEHLETVVFPGLLAGMDGFDEDARVAAILERERVVQQTIGPSMLKTGHGFVGFPCLRYGTYGYGT